MYWHIARRYLVLQLRRQLAEIGLAAFHSFTTDVPLCGSMGGFVVNGSALSLGNSNNMFSSHVPTE